MRVYWGFTTSRGFTMLSKVAAVIAGIVTGARGTDNRRLDVRRVLDRVRHRREFDDLARDSRLEHQHRVDDAATRVSGDQ